MENQVEMRRTECHNYNEDYHEPSSLLIQDKIIILIEWNAAHLTSISSS